MKTYHFLVLFLHIALYSCGQKPAGHRTPANAVELNDKIVDLVPHIDNVDSCKKAIAYLDSATTIDSNYFLGHYNKLMFLSTLADYGKCVKTVNHLIRLRPDAHDLYLLGGMYNEAINDTMTAKKYFKKSLHISNSVLDTLNKTNLNYLTFVTNKAAAMIMLGQDAEARVLSKKLYDEQTEELFREMIMVLMNSSRQEILNRYLYIAPVKYEATLKEPGGKN